jgi:hypothetical protein
MKNKFAGIHCMNRVAAAVTKQMRHIFNFKRQEMTNLKRKVSFAEIIENWTIYEL